MSVINDEQYYIYADAAHNFLPFLIVSYPQVAMHKATQAFNA